MPRVHTSRTVLSALILSFMFILTACGGSDDESGEVPMPEPPFVEPTPEPEIVHPPQKPDTLPTLPLLRPSDAAQAPIIQRAAQGGTTHVGAILGNAATAAVAHHGDVSVSYDGMLGGIDVQDLLTYLAADAKPYDRIKRWDDPPTIYLVLPDGSTTPQMVDDAVFAVQIINSFLPGDWQLAFGSTDNPTPGNRMTIFFRDVGLSERGVDGTTLQQYDATLKVVGANIYVLPDLWTNPTIISRNLQHRINLLAHEILHGLGRIHVPIDRSRIAGLTIMDPHVPGTGGFVLFAVDREALHAIHSELEPGDSLGIAAEKLGEWESRGMMLRGDYDIPEGNGSFGVSMRFGLARPWASGPTPWTLPAGNPGLSGSASWAGRLLGFTPEAQSVAGSAQLDVDLSTLSGDLDFQGLESWATGMPPGAVGTGQQWGDGDLSYDIQVLDNTFIQAGGDEGAITGAFFGPQHEGMGGVLERDDLTAAFGGDAIGLTVVFSLYACRHRVGYNPAALRMNAHNSPNSTARGESMAAKRLTKARKAGRPPTLTMPEPIDDTIDNVMDSVLTTPPKKRGEWKYMQRHQASEGKSSLRRGA